MKKPLALVRQNKPPTYFFKSLGEMAKQKQNGSSRPVLNLSIGSPDIPPSHRYQQKLAELLQDKNAYQYPGYNPIPEFKEALIDWYRLRFEVKLQSNEIIPLLGAKDGITHLPLALLEPGDEILVPNPGYPAYSAPNELVGVKVVNYDLIPEENFQINLPNLKQIVTPKTKCIWVNFPANPTGRVASLVELKAIVDFCLEHQLILLYDNAYAEITFGENIAPSILQIKGAKQIALEIGSFSKSHSFAGLRMGWAVGNQQIVEDLSTIKSQFDSGLSLPLQQLGAYALKHQDLEWHQLILTTYQNRLRILETLLLKLGLTFQSPGGGLYVWARIPDQFKNSTTYCQHLLDTRNILVTPGIAFGSNGDRYVRISICNNLERLDEYV